jgi:hypothetical protein
VTLFAFEQDKDKEYNVCSVLPHKPQTCQSLGIQTSQFKPNGRNRDINILQVPVCIHQELDERQRMVAAESAPNWKNVCISLLCDYVA